jgi:uncharacterized membrane protein YbhN (UPF0104 family)
LLRLVISFVIGVLLLVGLFLWVGVDRLWAAMSGASPFWLLVSALMVLPAYFFKGFALEISTFTC